MREEISEQEIQEILEAIKEALKPYVNQIREMSEMIKEARRKTQGTLEQIAKSQEEIRRLKYEAYLNSLSNGQYQGKINIH